MLHIFDSSKFNIQIDQLLDLLQPVAAHFVLSSCPAAKFYQLVLCGANSLQWGQWNPMGSIIGDLIGDLGNILNHSP